MDMEVNCCCITSRFYNTEDPVPLQSVSVDVRIDGFIANVHSTLVYKNTSKNPIEARYEFPMDDQSVVYHFEAQIEDRIIVAECQEKQQAKETYKDATKKGYGAMLMEEADYASDIFSCLVGNLPPDTEASIKFEYVTELSLQPDGVLTFLLPNILNPRYNPSIESGGSDNPSDVTYVKKGEVQPYEFKISATIINPAKIAAVKAAKDELNVKLNDDKTLAEVTLAKPFVANHDFTLDVSFEEVAKPHIIVEKGNDLKDGILKKDIVMLNFFPELRVADYTSNHEFIFVVDRSGSMEGSRIKMAKETLLLFLKSLPPGCYFNVIGFGDTFEVLFANGSLEYSEDSLKAATDLQRRMKANLGGTEILRPLRHIYEKLTALPTHAREILLLTDGDVMNTQAVIDLVKKNANNTRLFSFGIGEGASTSLIKGVARAGQGRAEFTKEGERLQPLVVRTLKAAMQLAISELQLDWQLGGGSPDLVQLPKELPPLFAGERLIVYALTSSDKTVLDGKVTLRGKIGGRKLEFGLDVDSGKNVASKDESLPIHRLAAKAQIKQLQDSGKNENKASIVLLSTSANVISCHTSMVGVDKERKEKVIGHLNRRNVPVMSDSQLSMQHYRYRSVPVARKSASRKKFKAAFLDDSSQESPFPLNSDAFVYNTCSVASDSMCSDDEEDFGEERSRDNDDDRSRENDDDRSRDNVDDRSRDNDDDRSRDNVDDRSRDNDDDDDSSRESNEPPPPAEPTYMDAVSLQKFSGEWKLDEDLANVLKTTLDALEKTSPVKALNVWATVLALSYLEAKFGNKRDEWEMIDMKARQWLDRQDREGHNVDNLLKIARSIVDQA